MGYKHQNGTAALSISMDKDVAAKFRELCKAHNRSVSDVIAQLCRGLVAAAAEPPLAAPVVNTTPDAET